MDYLSFIKDPEKTVKSLIRKLTHSGDVDLDRGLLNEIKSICKSAKGDLMTTVFKECLKHLHKEHSQVRVATVKLIDFLFQRSHIIREKLLDDFDVYLELTLCITQTAKIKLKLPPPKRYAALLQELSAKTINSWHSDFGAGYEKLRYTYRFLREHRLVDFSSFRVHTQEDLIKQRELEEKQEKILTRSIESKLLDYKKLKPEIEYLTVQIESLIEIITADPEAPAISDEIQDDAERSMECERQHHGIANLSQSVQVEFEPFIRIQKNQENKELLMNLRQLKKQLVEVEMLKLVEIEKTLTKRSEQLLSTLRDLISLKSRATNVVMKLSELKLVENEVNNNTSSIDNVNSDSDSDVFEEVGQKEGLETYIPKSMRTEYGLEAIDPKELMDSSNNTTKFIEESFVPIPSCSKSPENSPSKLALTCNVRLDNGRLCPRQDKLKCPFHGKIIPRNHAGIPLDETERLKEEKANSCNKVPEWQDPELLHDIKMATGVDLTLPNKKRKTKNLTKEKKLCDTRSCDVTPKQRLMKRLRKLNKSQ